MINFFFRNQISQYLKIIDHPDKIRKLHKKPVPLNGGLWFFIMLIIYNFGYLIFQIDLDYNIIYIISASILMFILGFIDDRISINANLRLLLFFLIFFIVCEANNNLQIKQIVFESIELKINLNIFSSLFTAFCMAAFINSINLVDGINSLANTILLIITLIIFYMFREEKILFYYLIFFLTINSIIIFKEKYFLGDSGSIGISSFLGFYIIYLYNTDIGSITKIFYTEDIFILMAFPGLDMIRVFFSRIINKKNPFKSERNHLHHYLLKKYKLSNTLFLYLIFMSIPIILNFIVGVYASYNLLFSIILYMVLLKIATYD
tara:strand:+ start:1264 stop:2223 length:960 start_codon:yes stop_codon:yes gene_type:complete